MSRCVEREIDAFMCALLFRLLSHAPALETITEEQTELFTGISYESDNGRRTVSMAFFTF